uniref:Glycosyltransferase n=1 Tax=Fervidobacterium pennivorans TaxID=93466 RepID=A0A7V4CPH1_FERPE
MDVFNEINKLVSEKNFSKAKELAQNVENEVDKYNLLGIVLYYESKIDDAVKAFKKALSINPVHPDVLFNYSKGLFEKGDYFESWRYLTRIPEKSWEVWDMLGDTQLKLNNPAMALHYYKKAYESSNISELKEKYEHIRRHYYKGQKLAIFCLPGLDNFIHDIASILSHIYEVKLVVTTNSEEIVKAYNWADIIWLEWANELAIEITNKLPKGDKKIVCRLHRYEAFTNFIKNINWDKIDRLILVAGHMKRVLERYHKEIYKKINEKIVVIDNGLDLNKFTFAVRQHGHNIAVAAYINHRKQPVEWLQIIGFLKNIDSRYQLHIAGSYQDPTFEYYFTNFISETGLEENVKLYGWVNDINSFLEDKNYLLSTSIHESFGYNIAEAMARGIKPIIHNYHGAKEQWPEELVYNFIYEIPNMLTGEYKSLFYREFVENNYSLESQVAKIQKMLNELGTSYRTSLANQTDEDFFKYAALLSQNKDYKGLANFVEKVILDENIPLERKLRIFPNIMYINMDGYERFKYLPDSIYEYFEEEGQKMLERYLKSNQNVHHANSEHTKKRILIILNTVKLNQSIGMILEKWLKTRKKINSNFEYHVLLTLSDTEVPLERHEKELLINYTDSFLLLNVAYSLEERFKRYIDYIRKLSPDVAIFFSINLANFVPLVYPIAKKFSKIVGQILPQDIETYYEKKLDFIVDWVLNDGVETKHRINLILPSNTELVDRNYNIRDRFKIPNDSKIAVSIGRPIKYLNPRFWEMIEEIAMQLPNVVFVFFGPTYDETFSKLVNKRLIEEKRVILAGFDKEAMAYLKDCDLYLNSFPLGTGLSFCEAYYAGLPIVTMLLPKPKDGEKHLGNEERGLLFPYRFYDKAEEIFPIAEFDGSIIVSEKAIEQYKELVIKVLTDVHFLQFLQSKRIVNQEEFTPDYFVKSLEKELEDLLKIKESNI